MTQAVDAYGYPNMILLGVSKIDALCNEKVPENKNAWYYNRN